MLLCVAFKDLLKFQFGFSVFPPTSPCGSSVVIILIQVGIGNIHIIVIVVIIVVVVIVVVLQM